MNVRLLRKIAKVIQEKPRELEMKILHCDEKGVYADKSCATAHCICGWGAVILDEDFDAGPSSHPFFGIDSAQRKRLFWVSTWPSNFRNAYRKRKTHAARARVTAARIEHFIKTKGAE